MNAAQVNIDSQMDALHDEALVFNQEGLIRCENYENCGVEYRPELGFGNHCSLACVDEMIHAAAAAQEADERHEATFDIDADHELALVLNLMVDISCYSNDLPGPLAKALDKALEEHTGLCITEHHNDYGQCVKAGCPVFERGGK